MIDRYFFRRLGYLTIVAALAAGGVASIRSLQTWLRHRRIDRAANIVGGELRAARNEAILHKQYVAVLMPTTQDANHGGVAERNFKGRAVRRCVLTGAPIRNFAKKKIQAYFANYAPGTDWSFLPDNFYIGYTQSFGEFGEQHTESRCNVVDDVPFPSGTSPQTLDSVRALIFTPKGAVVAAPSANASGKEYTEILIHSGIVMNTNQLRRADGQFKTATIRVNHRSGNIQYE